MALAANCWRRAAAGFAVGALLCGCAATNRPLQLRSGAEPAYPPAAKAAGIEGYVIVRYDVNAAGAVENASVVEGAPAGVFDAAALASVRRWRFEPRRVNGAAVAAPARVSTVRFKLAAANDYPSY